MESPIKAAQSILDWWALAGVDQSYGDRAIDRLSPVVDPPVVPGLPDAAPRPSAAATPPAAAQSTLAALPDTLDALREWIATSPDMPAAGPPASRIAPTGKAGAPLLVVTAMPDPIDVAMGTLLSGEPGELFDRMLAAIGQTRAGIGILSLAASPIPGGRIAPDAVVRLVEIARHHIALAKPRVVLVLGDKASRAVLATDVASARGRLLEINHKGAVMPAIATFHPRTLARNDQFKRAAWESLQQVEKVLAQK